MVEYCEILNEYNPKVDVYVYVKGRSHYAGTDRPSL